MPSVTLSIDGAIATLTLAVPAEGVGRGFMEELRGACEALADATDRVRAVVVASGGSDFASGWSPEALREAAGVGGFLAPLGSGCEALAAVPQPTIAAVRGRAHSVGLELALACDVRVTAADATFAMPEVSMGLVPFGGGTQRLPRAIGRAHALRLLLTGETIGATEAYRIGLVSEVAHVGEEGAAALAIASAIAARGPVATRFAKEALHRGLEQPLQQGLRTELDLTVILQTTADRAEGVSAFVERREPHFTGQ